MASNGTRNSTSAGQSTMTPEQRGRRIASIRSEIYTLNTRRNKVNSQIINLTTEQTNLNTYLGSWSTQKSLYNSNNIISEVVIINTFEGICADKIKEDMEECISDMDQTYNSVGGLNGDIHTQISRLNQYISNINNKISLLNNELNAL